MTKESGMGKTGVGLERYGDGDRFPRQFFLVDLPGIEKRKKGFSTPSHLWRLKDMDCRGVSGYVHHSGLWLTWFQATFSLKVHRTKLPIVILPT